VRIAMLGQNADELKKAVNWATNERVKLAAITPTRIDLTQVNVVINGRGVVIAWDVDANDWEVTAA
jgi:hypothetical protein